MKAKTLYKDFLESTPKEKQELLRLVSKWAACEDEADDEGYVYKHLSEKAYYFSGGMNSVLKN